MNVIHAIKNYPISKETGKVNGPGMNKLIILVSAAATTAIGFGMAQDYISEGRVSDLGVRCIVLLSVAALESGCKGWLLNSFDKNLPNNPNKTMWVPAGALTTLSILAMAASVGRGFQKTYSSEDDTSEGFMRQVGWIFGMGASNIAGICSAVALTKNYCFKWVDTTPGEIEL